MFNEGVFMTVRKTLIEEEYKEISIAEKLEILHSIAGSMPDAFIGKSIQSIKASMDDANIL